MLNPEIVFSINTKRNYFIDWLAEKTILQYHPEIKNSLRKTTPDGRFSSTLKSAGIQPEDPQPIIIDKFQGVTGQIFFDIITIGENRIEVSSRFTENTFTPYSKILVKIAETYPETSEVIAHYLNKKLSPSTADSGQTQSLLVRGNKWEILQHLQWTSGSYSFVTTQSSPTDKLNLEVQWFFRSDLAAVIGAVRLVDEGNSTRIFFVPKPCPSKDGAEKFTEFIQRIKKYFEGAIISENGGFSEIEQVAQAIKDFIRYITSEKRMTFWRFGDGQKRLWVQEPEKHAKDLLQTFLTARFGINYIFEEIIAGAGKIDLFFNPPNRESSIIELKMCGHGYSSGYAYEGIEQLEHYMENKKAKSGYLVIFDSRTRDFSQGFSDLVDENKSRITILFADVRPYVKRKDAPDGA